MPESETSPEAAVEIESSDVAVTIPAESEVVVKAAHLKSPVVSVTAAGVEKDAQEKPVEHAAPGKYCQTPNI